MCDVSYHWNDCWLSLQSCWFLLSCVDLDSKLSTRLMLSHSPSILIITLNWNPCSLTDTSVIGGQQTSTVSSKCSLFQWMLLMVWSCLDRFCSIFRVSDLFHRQLCHTFILYKLLTNISMLRYNVRPGYLFQIFSNFMVITSAYKSYISFWFYRVEDKLNFHC